MANTIMPAFREEAANQEGRIIGNILAGYGELELELCGCLAAVNGDLDLSIRLLFQVRGEERRLQTADKTLRTSCTNAGLGALYCEIYADFDWCRQLRNQYAHSHWYYTGRDGLCIVKLEELAKKKGPIGFLEASRLSIPLHLLIDQEAFLRTYRKASGISAKPTLLGRHQSPIRRYLHCPRDCRARKCTMEPPS